MLNDNDKPSEYGGTGKQRRRRGTASERLRNVYQTGDESGATQANDEAFMGDVPRSIIR